jgi:tight adherence protein B
VVFAITGLPTLSIPPAMGGALIPLLYHDRRRRALERDAVAAWPDGLRDVLAAVQSGMSLPRSVERLATEGPAPLREAFEPYPALATALGFEAALEHVRERLADPISDRVIEAMQVGHSRGGGALPEILSDLAEATTEDLWAAEQLRSGVLEQKINARAVFVLPWLVLVFLTSTPGDFRDFYSSMGGVLVMALGALVSGVGIVVAERLGRDEVEERVLA